jgi:cohesin complex subunit SA-1/2
MVSGRYKEAVDDYMNLLNGKEEPNEDEMFSLVSSLKKVDCFTNCHNMGHWDIWESKYVKAVWKKWPGIRVT